MGCAGEGTGCLDGDGVEWSCMAEGDVGKRACKRAMTPVIMIYGQHSKR